MFVRLIRQGYFYKELNGQNFYDARKLNLLMFLFSNHSKIDNSKITYHDKASFIFSFVKTKVDQNLCEAIEENEENFVKFIEDIVEISCEGIVDGYIRLKDVKRDGMINKFKTIKPEIVNKFIQILFFNKNEQRSGGLTFNELNKKFDEDKFIFTSGYVREIAWDIFSKGKGNDIEKEEAEKDIEKGSIN
jgi:disulfide oxidoreductase YuzD